MPMPMLFPVDDPKVIVQYNAICKLVRKHPDLVAIAYQSNWYVILCCKDTAAATVIYRSLHNLYQWKIQDRPGKKYPERVYLNIKFIR